jgi:hypothetical protein
MPAIMEVRDLPFVFMTSIFNGCKLKAIVSPAKSLGKRVSRKAGNCLWRVDLCHRTGKEMEQNTLFRPAMKSQLTLY